MLQLLGLHVWAWVLGCHGGVRAGWDRGRVLTLGLLWKTKGRVLGRVHDEVVGRWGQWHAWQPIEVAQVLNSAWLSREHTGHAGSHSGVPPACGPAGIDCLWAPCPQGLFTPNLN